jgi:hypothetical protein
MLIFPFRKQHFEEGLRSCSPLFIKMGCGLRVPQPYAAQPRSGMQSKARLLPVDERAVCGYNPAAGVTAAVTPPRSEMI